MDTDNDSATEKKVYSRSAPFLYVNGYFSLFLLCSGWQYINRK